MNKKLFLALFAGTISIVTTFVQKTDAMNSSRFSRFSSNVKSFSKETATPQPSRTPLRNEDDVKKFFSPPSREESSTKARSESMSETRKPVERQAVGTREKIERQQATSASSPERTRTEREAKEQTATETVGTREKIVREKLPDLPKERIRTEREATEQKVDTQKSNTGKKVAVVGGAGALGAVGAAGLVGVIGAVGAAGLLSTSSSSSGPEVAPEKPAGDIGLRDSGSGVAGSFETFEPIN